MYKLIHDTICEEHSLHNLGAIYNNSDYIDNVIKYFNDSKDILILLDILNLFCLFISKSINNEPSATKKRIIENFLDEINQRMLEHSFGYQYENSLLVRVDTKHTHKEIVKPSFILLKDKRFKNADEEYRDGFEAFKRGDYENVFVECNKAFESTMKIICEINKFEYNQNDTSSKLIKKLSESGFIKGYNEDMLNGLSKVLSAVSTLRNKEGGHGKGVKEEIKDVSYVNFALHLTATKILFLMERQSEFLK